MKTRISKVYRNVTEDMQQLNREIIERDGRCVLCNSRRNLDVHEIIPRSAFGSKRMSLCLMPFNRVTICRQCHEKAHSRQIREKLIEIQRIKYHAEWESFYADR